MLRDITVQNYRCFEDFHVDGFERVNLFVGNNNSGKTSLLEAIYLLTSDNASTSLIDIAFARREIIEVPPLHKEIELAIELQKRLIQVEPIKHIFYSHKIAPEYEIKIFTQNSNNNSSELLIYYFDKFLNFKFTNDLVLRKIEKIPLSDMYTVNLANVSLTRNKENNIFISDKKEKVEQMMLIWQQIYLANKEDNIVQALQIIEPKIERVGFSKQGNRDVVRLKVSGYDEPIPLSSMGEGIYRLLNLSMALTKTENGFLLVDEIETGLHYKAQTDMWKLILETTQQLNVQVFATTHSWDCIEAFQEALSQVEDQSIGKLFRLDSKYGKFRAVEYDAEDLDVAMRQSIEVR